jgi:nonsense-mediated mRNA decay protein 3
LCGKKTENTLKGYCEDCYKKQFNLIRVPEEVVVTACSRCRRIKEGKKWKDGDIADKIRDGVKILGKDVRLRIEIGDTAKVYAKGYLEGYGKIKEEVHEVKIKVNKQLCSLCSKESGKYYETTIQIRGVMTDDDLNDINDIVLKRDGYYRIKEVKGGYDLFVSSKSLAKKIAEFLMKKYKIRAKMSLKLMTKKDGMDIYRDTILLRIS